MRYSLLLLLIFCTAIVLGQKKDSIAQIAAIDLFNTQQEALADPEYATSNAFVPSPLHASKELLYNAMSFRFASGRFRYRGYESNQFKATINGICINGLYEQSVPWHHWSGLNEVMSNQQLIPGAIEQEYAFGGAAFNNYISLEAASIRKQHQVTAVYSNRNYGTRLGYAWSSGWNNKKMAIAFMVSRRQNAQPLYYNHFFEATSYLLSVEKRIASGSLNVLIAGAHIHRSSNGALTNEYRNLAGGIKANNNDAATSFAHQPYIILSSKQQLREDIRLNFAASYSKGKQYQTGLDWYAAPDPRPDYYRYLPSFQMDSLLQLQVQKQWDQNSNLHTIDWRRLYTVNKNSLAQMPGINGFKSAYILEQRTRDIDRIDLAFRLNQQITDSDEWVLQLYYQQERIRLYKSVSDLLGGDYYVDWNQFGEDNSPNNTGKQNDLNIPDRILYVGDLFGYHYLLKLNQTFGFVQWTTRKRKYDLFFSAMLQQLSYERVGYMRNGVFPLNSFGSSTRHSFFTPAVKAGFTWKHNGRMYTQLHVLYQQEAPMVQDYFVSPRVNHLIHPDATIANFTQLEMSWLYNSPEYKLRVQTFVGYRAKGNNIQSFYHDGYRNLVSYVMSNINALHTGIEGSISYNLSPMITVEAALSIGNYVYIGQQSYQVFIDNETSVGEQGVVFSKGFHVPGTPQQAMNINLNFKPTGKLWMNISGSYLRSFWLDFNPLRRTNTVGLDARQPGREWIFLQEKLPDIFYVDAFLGSSFYLKPYKEKRRFPIQIFLSLANLLNTYFISGGYEQLRYGIDAKGNNRFPAKYFLSQRFNFSLTTRFNF